MNVDADKKIKSSFDEKYGKNWMGNLGEAYGHSLLIKPKSSHISLLERPSPL